MLRNQVRLRMTAIVMIATALAVCAVFQLDTSLLAAPVASNSVAGSSAVQPAGSATQQNLAEPADPQSGRPKRIAVMIELDMQPAAQVYASQVVNAADVDQVTAVTQAHLASVEEAQLAILSMLDQVDADVIFRTQRVYNGIAVIVAPEQKDVLLSMPGVAAVHTLTPQVPDHTRSVPFINAPAVWSGADGIPVNGEDITIAIIDTGIDYLHANFKGSRAYSDNNPEIVGDVPGFPGPKVIAGYDFVGDSYNADSDSSNYDPIPRPDPDPMDCYGHGTHVAGTAAGTGISSPQTLVSYDGPFDETTFDQLFAIGPGVAPAAKLIALKVFGCQGSSSLTTRAIEWAVDPNQDGDFSDHVDVINMSLGSNYGSLTDPAVIASDNAALIGVVVVASAGNEGDVYYVTGSPSVSNRTVSVAAVRDHLSSGAQGIATYFTSRGPRLGDGGLKPDIAAPGESIVSARSGEPGTQSRLLAGTSMAAPHIAGAMALLREIHPDWNVEELKALAMNTARLQSTSSSQVDGISSPTGPTRIGSGVIDLANALKTDVIAFNGDEQGAVGISFGSPEVIDSLAGVKNLRVHNKGADPATYRLTVHTAVDTPGVSFTLGEQHVTVPPGGYANVPVFLTAIAEELRYPPTSSVIGPLSSSSHWLSEESGYVLLWPVDGSFRSFLSGDDSSDSMSEADADFRYDPQTMQIDYSIRLTGFAPEQIETIQLQSALSSKNDVSTYDINIPVGWNDPTLPITGALTLDIADEPFLVSGGLHLQITTTKTDALTLDGQLVATSAILHVPIYAAPSPASDMRADKTTLAFSDEEDAIQAIHLVGNEIVAEDQAAGYMSLVSGFELQYSSLRRRTDSDDSLADLHYVGVTDNFTESPEQRIDDAKIYFGIATYGDWSTPNQVAFDIYIDADEDGQHDYRLFNSNSLGYSGSNQVSDTFVAVVEDLNTRTYSKRQLINDRSSYDADTNPFNTNIMVLPVDAADIGISETNPGFSYQVHSANVLSGAFVDITPTLHYDLTEKVIDLFSLNENAPIFNDRNGAIIRVRYATENVSADGDSPGILLLHHRNRSGSRAEVVGTRYEWPHSSYLPAIAAQ